jgi:hypothetical protein
MVTIGAKRFSQSKFFAAARGGLLFVHKKKGLLLLASCRFNET